MLRVKNQYQAEFSKIPKLTSERSSVCRKKKPRRPTTSERSHIAEETIKLAGSLGIGISGFRLPDSKNLKMRLTVNAEILWLFPEMRRKRREIQRRRIVNTQYIESFLGK